VKLCHINRSGPVF